MKCLIDSKVISVTALAIHVPDDLANIDAELLTDVDAEQFQILIEADLADPNYPPSNVLDEHPKRVSKVAWTEAEYTVTVAGGSAAILIANTNANVVSAKLIDINGLTIYEHTRNLSGIDTYQKLILDDGLHVSQAGFVYPYQIDEHTIKLRFSTGNEAVHVQVGIIQAGRLTYTGRDSSMGLAEGLKEYSIERELSNGAFYYKKRDIVRTFTGNIYLQREPDFYAFMHSIFRQKGKTPLFWMVTDLESMNWFVYARAKQLPSGIHSDFANSTINFDLIEVL